MAMICVRSARFSVLFGSFLVLCPTAHGQTTQTTSTKPNITMQGPAENSGALVPRNALGRPCLDVEAAALAQTINPEMLDHVVSIKNNCPRTIRVKACYYGSERCNEVTVMAYKRVDTILGTMRGVNFFRYTLTQR